jgi:hypothetical protein
MRTVTEQTCHLAMTRMGDGWRKAVVGSCMRWRGGASAAVLFCRLVISQSPSSSSSLCSSSASYPSSLELFACAAALVPLLTSPVLLAVCLCFSRQSGCRVRCSRWLLLMSSQPSPAHSSSQPPSRTPHAASPAATSGVAQRKKRILPDSWTLKYLYSPAIANAISR